jgi:hypothetical protein
MISGYMSSKSFYIFLIITIILIFILCISNIVAYGNILKNDNVEFNHTWAIILIVANAVLIVIAFVIMIILIVKFMKGRRTTVPMTAAGGAAAGDAAAGDAARTNYTISELKRLTDRLGEDWNQGLASNGGDCRNPFNVGCSGDLACSDGTLSLPCPGTTGNDNVINRLFAASQARGYFP